MAVAQKIDNILKSKGMSRRQLAIKAGGYFYGAVWGKVLFCVLCAFCEWFGYFITLPHWGGIVCILCIL